MRPVLVAGGAGYIGSHTVQALQKEHIPVIVLDNLSTGHKEAVCPDYFFAGDIADTDLVEHIISKYHIRSVIHFAAKSLVSESLEKPELYFDENTVKSFAFLAAAVRSGVKQVVFSSTAAVYGVPDQMPINEQTMLSPINPYGASKRMIEEYLEWMGRVDKVQWVALRYFNAAGAALDGSIGEDHDVETHLIPLVMKTAMGRRKKLSVYGSDYPTPDGTCIRDYVHVDDIAYAHMLALQALAEGMPSQVFNIGTGNGFSVREIVEKCQSITGRTLTLDWEERRAGDPPILVSDNRAIKDAVGWVPRNSDLDTILSSAWRWHSSHPKGYGGCQGKTTTAMPVRMPLPIWCCFPLF
ncbi:MAG TPA: UDP-glucose 4-epimerase GalE [Syntrophomonadaceae bacterium]|nr:UDP-glucose 4-epimerase GalE [Syntrophomonadaceae bacterium]